jgi:hypothetical protein
VSVVGQTWPHAPQLLVSDCVFTQALEQQESPFTQSVSLLQDVAQFEPPQTKGAQATVPPGLQVPAPSQVEAFCETPPEQEAAAHTVPLGQSAQAPDMQVPIFPQLEALSAGQESCGSVPFLTLWHVPLAPFVWALEQAWQVLPHELLQQKLSTQKPLWH